MKIFLRKSSWRAKDSNCGLEVYIAREGILKAGGAFLAMTLKELCDKNQVNLMSCTPSYLANLIDFPEFESVVNDDLTQKVFISLWGKPAYKSGDLARLN